MLQFYCRFRHILDDDEKDQVSWQRDYGRKAVVTPVSDETSLIKEESHRTSLHSSGQFSHLVLRVCEEERKIEKSKNKSNEVSSKTHLAWKLSKTISRKQGRYNPRKICFPQLHELPLNFPYLKNLKRLKENLKRFYKLFDFRKNKDHRKRGPCYKNVWHLSKRTATQRRKFWFSFDQKLRTSRNPTGCFKKLLWQNSQQRVRKIWFSHEDRIKTPALEIRTPQKSIMEKGRRLERRKIPSVCLSLSV